MGAPRFTGVSQEHCKHLRWDTQMSFPPSPPGRAETKYSACWSGDKLGVSSPNTEFTAPTFSGVDQASFGLRRVDIQISLRPIEPARLDAKKISRSSKRTVGLTSFATGSLSSTMRTAGPSVWPSRVTGA